MTWFPSRLSIRLIRFLELVLPGFGGVLYNCDPKRWTCTRDGCAQSNFSTSGQIVLRSYQLATMNLSPTAMATATALIPSSSTTGSTSSSETAAPICSSPSSISLASQGVDTKTIAVGSGVGVTLGVAVVALLFMFNQERRKNAQLRKKQFTVEAMNNQTRSMDRQDADRGIWKGGRYGPIVEMSDGRDKQELSAEPVQELVAEGVRRQ